ncbi:MAG: pirin [Zetaproteobacteria bacterium]|nr:MAG: pirin [Zetaproteobacteria bacterium]
MSREAKRIADAAVDIQFISPLEDQSVGYMARALVAATLPHSRPHTRQWVRRNGPFVLTITALHPSLGLPYGSVPRLVLCWICTEAVRTQSRELLLGRSLSEWMAQLGLVPTGGRWGTITRLHDQMLRLFSSAFSFSMHGDGEAAGRNITIASRYRLWWMNRAPGQRSLLPSEIVLSQEFFEEIVEHPVPLDMRALRALRRSPMALDIYAWLSWRMWRVRKPVLVPWQGLRLQFGADYADNAQGRKDFKKWFLHALRKVLLVMPGARVEVHQQGLLLSPSKLPVPPLPKPPKNA